jgi:hypothetical protein
VVMKKVKSLNLIDKNSKNSVWSTRNSGER